MINKIMTHEKNTDPKLVALFEYAIFFYGVLTFLLGLGLQVYWISKFIRWI